MKQHVRSPQIHPVLTRFAINERALLGLLGSRRPRKKRRQPARGYLAEQLTLLWKDLAKNALNGVIVVTVVAALFWLGPKLLFSFTQRVNPAQAESLSGNFELEVDEAVLEEKKQAAPPEKQSLPAFNENLPTGDWLVIPRIGVRSTLQSTESYEEALTTGVWWAPGFGGPGDQSAPMIVAGHRFGFKWWWEDDYWKYHSFYMLPNLEPGDTIEIISNKRKYEYAIYAGEEGKEITDYQADLILYTCKYLDSPIRIFRYARLVPPERKTPLEVL